MKILIIAVFTVATLVGTSFADPPNNVFVGVSVDLTTTTFAQSRGRHATVLLASSTLNGYILWRNTDPPIDLSSLRALGESAEASYGSKDIWFVADSGLAQVPNPLPVLALDDPSASLFIPLSVVKKIDSWKGRFAGHEAYGDPLDLPKWQVDLLMKPPVFSCSAKYAEMGNLYWVSYNKEVSEKELKPICEMAADPSPDQINAVTAKGKVFTITYAAD
jgi:hypothetical protein